MSVRFFLFVCVSMYEYIYVPMFVCSCSTIVHVYTGDKRWGHEKMKARVPDLETNTSREQTPRKEQNSSSVDRQDSLIDGSLRKRTPTKTYITSPPKGVAHVAGDASGLQVCLCGL